MIYKVYMDNYPYKDLHSSRKIRFKWTATFIYKDNTICLHMIFGDSWKGILNRLKKIYVAGQTMYAGVK